MPAASQVDKMLYSKQNSGKKADNDETMVENESHIS
jgi:hypothetical protein